LALPGGYHNEPWFIMKDRNGRALPMSVSALQ
jgi:hypothetical protein